MNLSPAESKALLELPAALARLAELLAENVRATKRVARRQARLGQLYYTADEVARELRFAKGCSVWQMPEVLAERIYPTGTATPRWTRAGLDRAVANMPRQPRAAGKRGIRHAA